MKSESAQHDNFVEGEDWKNPKGEICPSCKTNRMYTVECRNSLSRRDNSTYICTDCGDKEALEDLAQTAQHPEVEI